jgi:hypothetical protein
LAARRAEQPCCCPPHPRGYPCSLAPCARCTPRHGRPVAAPGAAAAAPCSRRNEQEVWLAAQDMRCTPRSGCPAAAPGATAAVPWTCVRAAGRKEVLHCALSDSKPVPSPCAQAAPAPAAVTSPAAAGREEADATAEWRCCTSASVSTRESPCGPPKSLQ